MANLVLPLLRSALRIFSAVFVQRKRRRSDRVPGVILHDPNADKPKDFDNPFYTAASQERIGDLIARSVTHSKPG
jgi:hypothetical protein